MCLRAAQKYDEAFQNFSKAHDHFLGLYGPDHFFVFVTWKNKVNTLNEQAKKSEVNELIQWGEENLKAFQ